MFDFRTVPVQTAVDAVLTWANLDWPVTRDQALAVRDRLGWTEFQGDYRIFTTNFGLDDPDGGLSANGHLDIIEFRLSSLAPKGAEAEVAERSWETHNALLAEFASLYGKPTQHTHRQITASRWILPNGAAITLLGADRMVKAVVKSPDLTLATEWGSEED